MGATGLGGQGGWGSERGCQRALLAPRWCPLESSFLCSLYNCRAQAGYWRDYADHQMGHGGEAEVKAVFSRCLLTCLSADLWRAYLNFLKKVGSVLRKESAASTAEAMAGRQQVELRRQMPGVTPAVRSACASGACGQGFHRRSRPAHPPCR